MDLAKSAPEAFAWNVSTYKLSISGHLFEKDKEDLDLESDIFGNGEANRDGEHSVDIELSPGGGHGGLHKAEGQFVALALYPANPVPEPVGRVVEVIDEWSPEVLMHCLYPKHEGGRPCRSEYGNRFWFPDFLEDRNGTLAPVTHAELKKVPGISLFSLLASDQLPQGVWGVIHRQLLPPQNEGINHVPDDKGGIQDVKQSFQTPEHDRRGGCEEQRRKCREQRGKSLHQDIRTAVATTRCQSASLIPVGVAKTYCEIGRGGYRWGTGATSTQLEARLLEQEPAEVLQGTR